MWRSVFLPATLVAITYSMTLNSCENKDFFGPRCQYKCHCAATDGGQPNTRCGANGECADGAGCELGWFGPACQYVDLANDSVVTFANGTKLSVLTDGDDQSCLTPSRIQVIHLTWTQPFIFRWLRLHVNNADVVRDFTVKFRSNDSQLINCSNPRVATVSGSSLDVYGDQEAPVTAVRLSGRGVKALCSVYVSGGRNVALLATASQSSMHSSDAATRAVDGNRNGDYRNGSCSHTGLGQQFATWNLSFTQPQLINRVLIYNRQECCSERLQGFVLTATSSDNLSFSYRDQTSQPQQVYQLMFPANNTPVSRIGIQATFQYQYNYVILTLCEVEIYGDTMCTAGRYGWDCEHTCNCSGECFVSTGRCPSACAAGYGGLDCLSPCPSQLYGLGCRSNCSLMCVDDGGRVCDHVSGKCLAGCRPDYNGTECQIAPSSGSPQDSSLAGPVLGAAIAVFLVVVAALIAFICWRRRRDSASAGRLVAKSSNNIGDSNQDILMSELPKSKMSEVDNSGNTHVKPQATNGDYYNFTPVSETNSSTRIAIKELDVFMSTHDKSFFQEQFASIPANEEATMVVGQSSENKNKNRYKNICAYDHSRVHLQPGKHKRHGDYINASYVQGYQGEELFIASQGPTKAILGDFVQMLWEQQVDKVVMLTNLVEQGTHKCERYWPEDGEVKLGEVTVKLATTQVFADYTIRILQLSTKGGPVQTITQFHFTSWPDKDVPTAPWGLVDFEQRVASYQTSKPIVVHCSAGVGRTGTFIALRNLTRQAEDTGFVDVFTTVTLLRRSRVNMVQTAGQYEFLHRSVQVAILCMGTTVTSSDVKERIQTLSLTSDTGHTNMEKEFQAVSNICDADDDKPAANNEGSHDDPNTVYQNSLAVANLPKNRCSQILPKEFYQVILQSSVDGTGNYINAVFVPSFTKQNQQILTQLPLPSTVGDFWRLVDQYKVSLVVAFEADLSLTDQTVGTYLPQTEHEVLSFGQFNIRTEQVTREQLWQQQEMVITRTTCRTKRKSSVKGYNQDSKKRKVDTETHLTHLKCLSNDLDAGNLLSLVKQVRSLAPASPDRILYMCRNGADYCGLACILSLLLDRVDSDQRLTIPLVVGAIKAIRPQVIPTLTQYRLLYDAISLYIDSVNVYSNF